MKNLIIATDFSETAMNATSYAAKLAEELNAQLIIYHAYQYPLPPDVPRLKKKFDEAYNEDKKRIEKIIIDLKKKVNIIFDYVLSPDPIMEELPKLVKKYHADLVLMGISGGNPLKRMLFGSTTISVLRNASFPVLVIPENAVFTKPDNILFAFLPKIIEKDNKLKILRNISDTFHSKIKILNIILPEAPELDHSEWEFHMNLLNDKLSKLDFSYLKIDAKNVLEGIEKGLEVSNANMLVMVPGKYSIWEAVNKKSSTRKVAMYIQVPLLILPNEN